MITPGIAARAPITRISPFTTAIRGTPKQIGGAKKMSETANIATPGVECWLYCDRTNPLPRRTGDVLRCEHGKIWIAYCDAYGWRWRRLYPVYRPLAYRRAVRALAPEHARVTPAVDKTLLPPPPPPPPAPKSGEGRPR